MRTRKGGTRKGYQEPFLAADTFSDRSPSRIGRAGRVGWHAGVRFNDNLNGFAARNVGQHRLPAVGIRLAVRIRMVVDDLRVGVEEVVSVAHRMNVGERQVRGTVTCYWAEIS